MFRDFQSFLDRYPQQKTNDWQLHFEIYSELKLQFDEEVRKQLAEYEVVQREALANHYQEQSNQKVQQQTKTITEVFDSKLRKEREKHEFVVLELKEQHAVQLMNQKTQLQEMHQREQQLL